MKSDAAGLLESLRAAPAFTNFSWLTADKAIRLVVGVFVGMWVARYLGPTGYGIFNYGLAVAGLAATLPALGLDAIVRRELVRAPEAAGRILGTTFFLRLAIAVGVYVVLVAGAFAFEPEPLARLAIAMAGILLVHQAALAIDLWFQSRLLSKFTVIAHNVSFLICSALRVTLILLEAPLEWFLYLLGFEFFLASALLLVVYLRGRARTPPWQWDAGLARQLVGESWPLAVAGIATLIYVRIDQVMLRSISGPAETGIYAAGARIMEILHTLPLMLAASLAPGLVRARTDAADYERRMQRYFNLSAGTAWAAALLCAAVAPWFIPFFFGEAYASGGRMLVVLAFSLPLIALGVARQEYLVLEGRQHFQLATTLVGAALNVGLNFWAIPRWGGLGAAAVTIASHLVADLLTSALWPPARGIARWQFRALFGLWRVPPRAATP